MSPAPIALALALLATAPAPASASAPAASPIPATKAAPASVPATKAASAPVPARSEGQRGASTENRVAEAFLSRLGEVGPELKPGQWVTYRLSGGPGREAFWRLAVVGREQDLAGRPGTWIELEFGQHPNMLSPLGQLRVLLSQTPQGTWAITRMFVAFAAAKPQEVDPSQLPDATAAPSAGQAPAPQRASSAASGGLRTVRGREQRMMTAAGSVLAVPLDLYYRSTRVRRLWVSEQIPVLHLVKVELPGVPHALEVRDYGTDARPMMVLPNPDAPKLTLESPGAPFPVGARPQETPP